MKMRMEVCVASATALGFVALGTCWLASGHPNEDAFILFRYVENLASGEGIVYNPGGPRAEGATDFLWLVALGGLRALGLDVALAALGLNAIGAGIVAALSLRALPTACRSLRFGAVLGIPLVLLLLLGHGALAAYEGFSTMLYAALYVVASATFLGESRRRAGLLPAIGLALGLLRPDGVVVGLGFAALGMLAARRDQSLRAYTASLLACGVLGVAYFLWRWSYFGLLLPLPLYVKTQGPGSSLLASRLPELASVLPGLDWHLRWLTGGSSPLALATASVVLGVVARRDDMPSLRDLALALAPGVLLLIELLFAQQTQNVAYRFQAPVFLLVAFALFRLAALVLTRAVERSRVLLVGGCLLFATLPSAWSGAREIRGALLPRSPSYLPDYTPALGTLLGPADRAATTEAGQLAFWTHAAVTDVVGLNEPRFASRTPTSSDLAELAPDVVLIHHDDILDVERILERVPGGGPIREVSPEALRDAVASRYHAYVASVERRSPASEGGTDMLATRRGALALILHLSASDAYQILLVDQREAGLFKHVWGFRKEWPHAARAVELLRETVTRRGSTSYLGVRGWHRARRAS